MNVIPFTFSFISDTYESKGYLLLSCMLLGLQDSKAGAM